MLASEWVNQRELQQFLTRLRLQRGNSIKRTREPERLMEMKMKMKVGTVMC